MRSRDAESAFASLWAKTHASVQHETTAAGVCAWFFVDVRLDDGTVVTTHCANSGSMKTCFVEGGRVWLTHEDDPKRAVHGVEILAYRAAASVKRVELDRRIPVVFDRLPVVATMQAQSKAVSASGHR